MLVNECSQLVGFNLPGDASGLRRAITMSSLRTALARKNVSAIVAGSRCLSAVELAQQQADLAIEKARKAEGDAASARDKTQRLSVLLEQSRQENKQLEKQAGQAKFSAEKALKRADQIQAEIEIIRTEAESRSGH